MSGSAFGFEIVGTDWYGNAVVDIAGGYGQSPYAYTVPAHAVGGLELVGAPTRRQYYDRLARMNGLAALDAAATSHAGRQLARGAGARPLGRGAPAPMMPSVGGGCNIVPVPMLPPEPMVVEKTPQKFRTQYLGFDSGATAIVAGAQALVTVVPQQLFKGIRLSIPGNIAGSFVINDLKVANLSQAVVAGGVPALTFSHDATDTELELDTCQAGSQIVLDITNISLADLRFRATMIGKVAY